MESREASGRQQGSFRFDLSQSTVETSSAALVDEQTTDRRPPPYFTGGKDEKTTGKAERAKNIAMRAGKQSDHGAHHLDCWEKGHWVEREDGVDREALSGLRRSSWAGPRQDRPFKASDALRLACRWRGSRVKCGTGAAVARNPQAVRQQGSQAPRHITSRSHRPTTSHLQLHSLDPTETGTEIFKRADPITVKSFFLKSILTMAFRPLSGRGMHPSCI